VPSAFFLRRVEPGYDSGAMRRFDHIGIPTDEERPGEMYVPETKVWVTDPLQHPQRIEYLRFASDSPVTGPLRTQPHIAFQVDDLEREVADSEVLLGPFYATKTLQVVFVTQDGALFEFMHTPNGGHWFISRGE
jgi:hypothetical protein